AGSISLPLRYARGLHAGHPSGISFPRLLVSSSSNIIFTKESPINPERLATLIAESAANKKAEDVIAIDLRGISSFTDFFVVCSGTSEPHLKAISGEIQDKLRDDHGIRPSNV